MSLHMQASPAANPLDVMEQIVSANEWSFDRRSDAEMAAEAPGKWCDYVAVFQLVRRNLGNAFHLHVRSQGARRLAVLHSTSCWR